MPSTLHPVSDAQVHLYRGLYRAALLLAYPLVALRLRWRSRREPEYGERIRERYGHIPAAIPEHPIWFHAVSAGEVIACTPLLAALSRQFPQHDFLVTTTTPTGAVALARHFDQQFQNVHHLYAPYDFKQVQKRFFERVKPALLVLVETELWPNQLSQARKRAIPAFLVNGRLSERSAARYQRMRPLVADMLSGLRGLACQSDAHAQRFLALGARPEAVQVCGSLKFDIELPHDHHQKVAALKDAWRLENRFVWCAGSTHEGEEAQVLSAHERLLETDPHALLILAPRHPVRCDDVAGLLQRRQLGFVRLSDQTQAIAPPQVLLVDTLGDLQTIYGIADIAFLGGSLVSAGGHNPIEAAVCSVPLLIGPEYFNFPDIVAAFAAAGALEVVTDAQHLAARLLEAHLDAEERQRRGAEALQVVIENRGALAVLVEMLRAEIESLSLLNDL